MHHEMTHQGGGDREKLDQLLASGEYISAYALLTEKLADVESFKLLWERSAAICRQAGRTALATEIYEELVSSGAASTASVFEYAEILLDANMLTKAQQVVRTHSTGTVPSAAAAQTLYRLFEGSDPGYALQRIPLDMCAEPDVALIRVDLLRRVGALKQALEFLDSVIPGLKNPSRFLVRKGRTLETLGHWAQAEALWTEISASGAASPSECLFNLIRLQIRQDKSEAAQRNLLELLGSPEEPHQKIRAAMLLDARKLVLELFEAVLSDPSDGSTDPDWQRLSDLALSFGMLGVYAKIVREKLPAGGPEAAILQRVQEALPGAEILNADAALRAPDVFLNQFAFAKPRRSAHTEAVLLVNPTLSMGGAERQFVQLVRALKETGLAPNLIHTALFSLNHDRGHDFFLAELQAEGVTVHDLSQAPQRPIDMTDEVQVLTHLLPTPLRDDAVRLCTLIQTLRPRVVHGWQDRAALASGWAGLTAGTAQIVLSARNMQPSSRGQSLHYAHGMYRDLVARPQVQMTANAELGARDYETWLELPQGKIDVLRNAMPPLPKIRRRRTAAPITLGGVFRLAYNKRPELWLRTFRALFDLSERPLRASIFGRGPLEDRCKALISELNLSNVELITETTDIADICGSVDAVVLMSRVEGIPNALLEAQGCGLPVVGCDVGGTREACLRDGPGAALLLPEDVTPDLAAARIAAWLPSALKGGAQARKRFIEANFSVDRLTRDIKRLYKLDPHA